MIFNATRARVEDQGQPPEAFLRELVEWGRKAPDEIFSPNTAPDDVFGILAPLLGNADRPRWDDLAHRKAALLECIRVHAGFESGWRWGEGVDRTNHRSQTHREGEETGLFQVSFDSLNLGSGALWPFARERGISTVEAFIPAMKLDHELALEFYARLVRISYKWAGPLIREHGDSARLWFRRDAVSEFRDLLA